MEYDKIFERIDTALKSYVRGKEAPGAVMRYITRLVEAANDVQKAELEKHDAENERKETLDAYNDALERERKADERFLDAHQALDDMLGRYGERK